MTRVPDGATDEVWIRRLIDGWVEAVRAKDVDALMSHYAPEVLSFDLAPPLRQRGAESIRKSLEEWFPSFRGSVGWEIQDLRITTGGEVAYCTSLSRIRGERTNGEDTDVWVRATICCRRSDGRWLIAHEHVSVPFYMDGSLRAAVDLKP